MSWKISVLKRLWQPIFNVIMNVNISLCKIRFLQSYLETIQKNLQCIDFNLVFLCYFQSGIFNSKFQSLHWSIGLASRIKSSTHFVSFIDFCIISLNCLQIRSDSSQVVNESIPQIYAKATEMRQIYRKIDKLEVCI